MQRLAQRSRLLSRTPRPHGAVVAAISVVEASPSPPTKAQLNGSWDLVFSSASKIKQFQYIPIDEKLVQELGKSEKNIMLRGDISPLLVNEITGNAEMKDGGVVAFQWKQARARAARWGHTVAGRGGGSACSPPAAAAPSRVKEP